MDCSTISINLENSERNSEGSNRSSPENLKKIPTSQHHTNNTSQMLATNLSLVSHQQLNPSNSVNSRHSLNLAAAAAAAAAAVSHLPHHPNLSLLNTLNVSGMFNHHTSPLDLMNVSHHHTNIGVQPPPPPRTYNSPPPISTNDPAANDCKLVDYRGQKVAAFIISGDTMLCLPQAFELFLKHLVGGLHTVYTKLKRLDIVPLVCNVEQVRILRGLGAIQPGVNRCKLLSCKDFDTLYRDCTTASSRPGRPPKRGPPINLNISPHLQLKKARLENGEYPYENGNLAENLGRLEKSPLLANGYNNPPHLNHISFLQMPHTTTTAHNSLMSPSMSHNTHPIRDSDNPLTTNYLKNQTIEALARSGIWENCRAAYEDIVKHLERLRDEKIDTERAALIDEKIRDLSNNNIHNNKIRDHDTDSLISSSPVLNLSKNCTVPVEDDRSQNSSESVLTKAEENRPKNNDDDIDDIDNDDGDYNDDVFSSNQLVNENVADDDDEDDDDIEDSNQERNSEFNDEKDIDDEIDDKKFGSNEPNDDQQVINYANSSDREEEKRHENINRHQTDENEDEDDENALTLSLNSTLSSSTETLLRNIQGLLKLATENARHQEQKFHYEKGTNSHMTYLLSLAQYYLYLAATHNNF